MGKTMRTLYFEEHGKHVIIQIRRVAFYLQGMLLALKAVQEVHLSFTP